MRPRGEICQALRDAAATPATVREVCERAQVGYDVGRYTASRMLQRGDLLWSDEPSQRTPGPGRPAARVVAAPAGPQSWENVMDAWDELQRAFWEAPPSNV